VQRSQVRQRWKEGQLWEACKSAKRSELHNAKTIEALFEAAGVAVLPTPAGPPQPKS
jgi:hypothetical protein